MDDDAPDLEAEELELEFLVIQPPGSADEDDDDDDCSPPPPLDFFQFPD
jgi:hypothetical protein